MIELLGQIKTIMGTQNGLKLEKCIGRTFYSQLSISCVKVASDSLPYVVDIAIRQKNPPDHGRKACDCHTKFTNC